MRGIPFWHQVIDLENVLFYFPVEGILHLFLVYLDFIIGLVPYFIKLNDMIDPYLNGIRLIEQIPQ